MSYILPDDPRVIQGRNEEERKQKRIRQSFRYGADEFSEITLAAMSDLANEKSESWKVIPHCKEQLVGILQDILANVPRHPRAVAKAIYDYVDRRMKFAPDPPEYERIASPCAMIQALTQGNAMGDCDDFAVVLATLFRLSGLKVRYHAVSNLPGNYRPIPELDHVFAEVLIGNLWWKADPVAPRKDWTESRHAFKEIN